ncbi:MAG: serine/threonine protein kinase, partial [Chthoniobacterales bacterium]|nr:serine/threonine protein kinase [Chthoniobacterales bacterium]
MNSPYDSLEIIISEPCPACGANVSTLGLALMAEVVCPACGNSFNVRTKLGQFRLLKKLGSGGMGSAYRAFDEQLGREVALKVLHREISGSEQEQRKLAEEARRTALINHPNVVKVFNYGSANGQFYLAMELVPNGSLDDLITLQGRVPEMQVLNVAIQIASGLKAAQEVGLIHRDIKPGNILFADAHTAKLVDFGLALVMDEVAAQKGEIWGTPYYVAPEKLDGRDEDFRSDIYSLGGTIFHALAGRPPYEAETASMVALKQLHSHIVNLQSFAPDVSDETNYIVNRMMAKNPDERYQSYDELIEHLQYARQKLAERLRNPAAARPQPIQLESTEQKKATALILLSVIGGLFLLGLVGYLNRTRIAEAFGLEVNVRDSSLAQATASARKQVTNGNLQNAIQILNTALQSPQLSQPDKNWAILQLSIFYILNDELSLAEKNLRVLKEQGLFSEGQESERLANFFVNMANFLLQK